MLSMQRAVLVIKSKIMKQEMQKSIIMLRTAAETLARQKVINKDVYDFFAIEIKSLSESIEKIEEINNLDKTLLTFTDKEKYVNDHINLADTSLLCKELSKRKDISDDFTIIVSNGKMDSYEKESINPHRQQAMV